MERFFLFLQKYHGDSTLGISIIIPTLPALPAETCAGKALAVFMERSREKAISEFDPPPPL